MILTLVLAAVLNPRKHDGWFIRIPVCDCISMITSDLISLPPPPPVKLLRPRLRKINPPKLLCIAPDDPKAVVPCEQLFKSASHP